MLRKSSFVESGGGWVLAQVVVLFLAVMLPTWTGTARSHGHPLQIFGWVLSVGGMLLFLAAVPVIGRALTPFPRPHERARLLMHGVFGFVRHPIYTGMIVSSLGWALVWLSPVGVVYAIVVAVFFDRKVVYEERMLRERFPEYGDYARRVRKFLPGVY